MTLATGTCETCGGGGSLFVDEDYARRYAATQRDPDDPSKAAAALEAARNTVRPCHQCQPGQYELWRQGRYKPRLGSPDRPQRGGRRKARRRRDTED